MKICANCGTQCEDHMNFCSNCGSALGEIAEEKPIPAEPAVEEEQGIPTAEQIRAEAAGVFESVDSGAPVEKVVVFADKPAEAEKAAEEAVEEAAAIAEEPAEEAAGEVAAAAEEAAGEAEEPVEEAVEEAAEEAAEETAAEAVVDTAEAVEEAAEEAAEETAENAEETVEEAGKAAEETVEEAAESVEETAAVAAEQPTITIEEDNSTVEIPEPQIKDAAEAAADDKAKAAAAAAAVPAAEKAKKAAKPRKKKGRRRKPISVIAILSMIFSLIGLASGGYACLFTFMDLKTAAIFFIPGLLGVVFGIIGIAVTGKESGKRGRALAVIGLILGLLSIILWVVGAFLLRDTVREKYGNTDLMSAIRTLLDRK